MPTARSSPFARRTATPPSPPSTPPPPPPPPPQPTEHRIAELVLHTGARVNRFEEKAAFAILPDLPAFPTPPAPADAVIRKADVIDLTTKMRRDGTLDWMPPAGRWVVLRMG